MKVVRVFVTAISIDMLDVTGMADVPGWEQIPAAVSVRGSGVLADNSRVSIDIKPTLAEQRKLLALLDQIADRIVAE